jgi:hypothetical protein
MEVVEKQWSHEMEVRYKHDKWQEDLEGEPSTPTSSYISGIPYEQGIKIQVERTIA